ncbi:MAG: YifB family Mg chelatase-like AAA ATPase, partial [Candidatus Falkowbacteria bacterium]|nr:YifB family Mg chelatase-like AAA ATPase [Candidatus Falkowbacteria bacterium]
LAAAVIGLDAELVEVEADTGGGELGSFAVVGLPDTAVQESRERVRSAIKNSGFDFPKLKVTVNLAPADLKKHGPSYDLAIAISILAATNKIIAQDDLTSVIFLGELALNGDLRPISGVLPAAMHARQKNIRTIFVPAANAPEAKLVKELTVIPVKNLRELTSHLGNIERISETEATDFDFTNVKIMFDMEHVRGQEHVKRAMEIAAAGGHNMLMTGPPGSGKTLIARTLPSILPNLTLTEALEITKLYSVAGMLNSGTALITSRPFRSPHHTASGVALVGGGAWPRPGEISLAHRGVLFLDEFAEFPRQVLENLRQPLEDGIINVSRAAGNLTFPAKFMLVAAMNPCPCGFYGDPEKKCICSPGQILNYRKKISGARARQRQRFTNTPFITNSEMGSEAVKCFCQFDSSSQQILKNAVEQMYLSARAYFRLLKIARTIADLDSADNILTRHVAEALQYRPKIE